MSQGPIGGLNYVIRRTFAQLKIFSAAAFAPVAPSTGQAVAANGDPNGNVIISGVGGYSSQLALANTTGTVIKATPGMLIRAIVLIAGSGAGAIYDTAATASSYATSQQVATIPNTVGIYEFDFPCLAGIVVATGTGQQVSISYQ
jgi:hypothetical protein